jgi:hypothetical protein
MLAKNLYRSGSGSGSGTGSGRFQKSDPDPVKNRPDPQHWLLGRPNSEPHHLYF